VGVEEEVGGAELAGHTYLFHRGEVLLPSSHKQTCRKVIWIEAIERLWPQWVLQPGGNCVAAIHFASWK